MTLSPELTTLCLIALGVGVLILLGGFLMLRVMRGSVFGLGMIFMRLLTEGKEESTTAQNVRMPPHSATDLRAKAESLDFDAAVAKYEQKDSASDREDQSGGLPL